MNRLTMRAMLAAAVLAAACLGGCGGSSSSSSGSGSGPFPGGPQGPSRPPPSGDPGITVTSMRAPVYSTADCPRFLDTRAAIAALDLGNASVRAVNDFLLDVDRDAHAVFARRPYDFINWIAGNGGRVDLVTVGVATHETMHMVDFLLRGCTPANAYKVVFRREVLVTGIRHGDTPSMTVVADHIAPGLKSEPRYDTYITEAVPDNDLSILLDELAAYTAGAHTEIRMLADDQTGGFRGSLDGNLGGTVNLMVYLQVYLKALRLDDPDAYATIRNRPQTLDAIQAIWTHAEDALRDAFDFVDNGTLVINDDYFDAAYSADLLDELDAIGIDHASRRSWSGSYLP